MDIDPISGSIEYKETPRRGEKNMARERSSRSSARGKEETFRQGETPGSGEYECVSCKTGWKVTLSEEKSRLPPCGNCGPGVSAEYKKV